MEKYDKLTQSFSKLQSDISKDILSAGYVLGIIFGVVGFSLLVIQVSKFLKIRAISKWPIIEDGGIIRDSYMENSSNNLTYSIVLVSQKYSQLAYRTRASFTYKIRGKTYVSNQISYNEPWQSNPITAKIENDLFTKGAKVDIRVNPTNADEAYIMNKPFDSYLQLLIAIVLSLLSIYIIYRV